METGQNIIEVLAYYLNKLKVRNPLLFVILQVAISTVAFLIHIDKLSFDFLIVGYDDEILMFLLAVIAAISPRTTKLAESYEQKSKVTENSTENTPDFNSYTDPNKD